MSIRSLYINKIISVFFAIIILFGLDGCGVRSIRDDNSTINKNYAKETFEIYYSAKKSDLSINKSTEKWGELECGECTYYEFDSYSVNSNEKNLFHNVMIIRTDDKAISWFLYDDNDFSTYILNYNLGIDKHSQKHSKQDANNELKENKSNDNLIPTSSGTYNWSELDGNLYFLNSEKKDRALSVDVIVNEDGTEVIEFWCCAQTTWRILCADSDESKKTEEDGKTLYSFTGYIYDIYENGEVIASGADPIDTILIVFDVDRNEFVVTSSKELIDGEYSYPITCSGTYVAE